MNKNDDKRSHPTALIADDDPITRRLLRAFLEKMNFEVIETADGEELVSACVDAKPTIVVTDIQMPTMDGLEACAEIRKTHSAAALPIVAISGWYDEERINRAAEVGVTRCLIKPIEWEAFEGHVTTALEEAADNDVADNRDRDSA